MKKSVIKIVIETCLYYIFALSTLIFAKLGYTVVSVICCAVSYIITVPVLFNIIILVSEKLHISEKINKKILFTILGIVFFLLFLRTCKHLY